VPARGPLRDFQQGIQAPGITPGRIEAAVTRFGTSTGGEYLIGNVGLSKRLNDPVDTVVTVRPAVFASK
jgi:heavy-metal exporter, HME family